MPGCLRQVFLHNLTGSVRHSSRAIGDSDTASHLPFGRDMDMDTD
ncbi:uncharacterized protein RAG0_05330 [Rhynchosporium agropyri]|uniref:Uncharacterized protein n=1 Tax=Rhynchosporium agropyri TaxID=914238 RepID=A0A1E1KCR7_9HELO|nr:uncharacterized protein RAG0_05330 [Rhynchosporium agropyri]